MGRILALVLLAIFRKYSDASRKEITALVGLDTVEGNRGRLSKANPGSVKGETAWSELSSMKDTLCSQAQLSGEGSLSEIEASLWGQVLQSNNQLPIRHHRKIRQNSQSNE